MKTGKTHTWVEAKRKDVVAKNNTKHMALDGTEWSKTTQLTKRSSSKGFGLFLSHFPQYFVILFFCSFLLFY